MPWLSKVHSAQCTSDSDDHLSENYQRPGLKGQYEVLQTTHHSGLMTVDVSIKSRFLETLQNCIDLSSFLFCKILV